MQNRAYQRHERPFSWDGSWQLSPLEQQTSLEAAILKLSILQQKRVQSRLWHPFDFRRRRRQRPGYGMKLLRSRVRIALEHLPVFVTGRCAYMAPYVPNLA